MSEPQRRPPRRRRKIIGRLFLSVAFGSVLVVFGVRYYSFHIGVPDEVTIPTGDRLHRCGDAQNCVDDEFADGIAEVQNETPEEVAKRSERVLSSLMTFVQRDGATLLPSYKSNNYFASVYRSRVFAFPDDVEFLYLANTHRIRIRSASRIGSGDLGVNRKRVHRIIRHWKYRG